MNRTQQKLIGTYLPVTLTVIILELALDTTTLMWLLKYLVVLSLFFWSFLMPKRSRDQERLSLSLLFVAVGDAFLYLPLALGYGESAFIPYGMVMFLLAYGCLIRVYGQGLQGGRTEVLVSIPVLAVFLLGAAVLRRMAPGPLVGLVLVFWVVLCTMLWMASCTLSSHSPYRRHGRVIALSGVLMVVCDVGVGLGLFYPIPSTLVYHLAQSVIWAAYIPAWMLIAYLVAEERPLVERTRWIPEASAQSGRVLEERTESGMVQEERTERAHEKKGQ